VRLGDGIPTGLSPDGKRVLAIVPGVPTEVVVLPTGAGETRKLPRGPLVHHGWAAWLPDGRRIVVSGAEPDRGTRLYLQDVEGGEPREIAGLGDDLAPLGWTDRPGILFAYPRAEARMSSVYRVDVATGQRQLWRELGLADPTGAPRVGMISVSPDGQVYAYAFNRSDFDLFLVSGVF
jgi:hypothetical protein